MVHLPSTMFVYQTAKQVEIVLSDNEVDRKNLLLRSTQTMKQQQQQQQQQEQQQQQNKKCIPSFHRIHGATVY